MTVCGSLRRACVNSEAIRADAISGNTHRNFPNVGKNPTIDSNRDVLNRRAVASVTSSA